MKNYESRGALQSFRKKEDGGTKRLENIDVGAALFKDRKGLSLLVGSNIYRFPEAFIIFKRVQIMKY